MMIESITGVVLAGGKSTRMGRNKAILPYRDKKLVDAPIESLSRIFSCTILSVHDNSDFPDYKLTKVVDQYQEIGPLGGITSVLEAGFQRIFCVACDMPFLNEPLIRYICTFSDYEAVIPIWDNRPEVLHAIYSQTLLRNFQPAIAGGSYKITDSLGEATVRFIGQEEIRAHDPEGKSFRNVNDPSDYAKL